MEGDKQKNVQEHAGNSGFLIPQLGHDTSINCLVQLSKSDYGSIVVLNQSFRSLLKNGELCLFGSAKPQRNSNISDGCDQHGNILNSSELYNSDTSTWEVLPDMNIPRRMFCCVYGWEILCSWCFVYNCAVMRC
ncbi:hypothetical protein P8452_32947 [Trifolium repens]|nr:hypothetical protein P8452_32947 [Trifolium repens]